MSQAKSASETIADCLVICLEILSRVAEILPLGVGFLLGSWVCFWPREGSGTVEVQPASGGRTVPQCRPGKKQGIGMD